MIRALLERWIASLARIVEIIFICANIKYLYLATIPNDDRIGSNFTIGGLHVRYKMESFTLSTTLLWCTHTYIDTNIFHKFKHYPATGFELLNIVNKVWKKLISFVQCTVVWCVWEPRVISRKSIFEKLRYPHFLKVQQTLNRLSFTSLRNIDYWPSYRWSKNTTPRNQNIDNLTSTSCEAYFLKVVIVTSTENLCLHHMRLSGSQN